VMLQAVAFPILLQNNQELNSVELVEGSTYLGQPLPFSITALIWIEVLVIGYIELQRNAEF
ncbi:chlorophyll a-b binding protein CP29.1 chloroplastic-like, partial [Trifolium medium]|nr:chlorophyll a-b binding protein CP29.1 chloroplastic-like [Trifolium medium]